MKALSLQGPWAYYERKNAENEARINQLLLESAHWKQVADNAQQSLAKLQQEKQQLQQLRIPALEEEGSRAFESIKRLEKEMEAMDAVHQENEQQMLEQVTQLKAELGQLSTDNLFLKNELAKSIHLKQTTSSKVEDVRKKLGLNHAEAEFFIRDLDQTKQANKSLSKENAQLAADKAHLQQQCESRSSHCMTLIADNKRLQQQVSDLRNQVTSLSQDNWQLKQEVAAAAKLQKKLQARKPAPERPQWQDQVSKPTWGKAAGQKQAASAQHPPGSRPAWQEITNTVVDSRGSATGAPKKEVNANKASRSSPGPASGAPAAGTWSENMDPDVGGFKMNALKEALMARQQRLVSAAAHS